MAFAVILEKAQKICEKLNEELKRPRQNKRIGQINQLKTILLFFSPNNRFKKKTKKHFHLEF